MRPSRSAFVFAALVLVPFAPLANSRHAGAENMNVGDFASTLTYGLSQTAAIRRGVTSTVSITKNFIDLVPFNMVSVSGGGASISNLRNGRNSSGTGFIAMDVSVPGTATLGGQITLKVGLTDEFRFRVVNRGLVSSITKTPDPSTLQPGTQWVAAVSGTDIGAPIVDTGVLACHTVTESNRSNTGVSFTLQRNATCSTSSFSFRLKKNAANDPPSWANTSGTSANFGFSYVPPPPSGVTCTSAPNIGTPVITAPFNQQVIVFGSGTASPAPVTITWQLNTQPGNVPAPNNEWVLGRSGTGLKGTATTTVIGTSKTFNFAIPGSWTVTLRAKNCGETAPSASITFSTRY